MFLLDFKELRPAQRSHCPVPLTKWYAWKGRPGLREVPPDTSVSLRSPYVTWRRRGLHGAGRMSPGWLRGAASLGFPTACLHRGRTQGWRDRLSPSSSLPSSPSLALHSKDLLYGLDFNQVAKKRWRREGDSYLTTLHVIFLFFFPFFC